MDRGAPLRDESRQDGDRRFESGSGLRLSLSLPRLGRGRIAFEQRPTTLDDLSERTDLEHVAQDLAGSAQTGFRSLCMFESRGPGKRESSWSLRAA